MRVTAGIPIQPLLNFAPNEKKFSGCRLKIVDIFFEFVFPNEIPNGTRRHFNALAELNCGEIFFHYDASQKTRVIKTGKVIWIFPDLCRNKCAFCLLSNV